MKYAIIAAGEGSRLAREGIWEPKPLVEVGGERLIDRLFRIFTANNADEIVVICNDRQSTFRENSTPWFKWTTRSFAVHCQDNAEFDA